MSCVNSIVVVDDEPAQLDSVSRILIERGFIVSSFNEVDKALEFINLNQPDLVLTDLRLPKVDGIEFIKRIKTFNDDIECILMTGYSSVDSAVDAMRLGVRDYLLKPFRSSELLAIVDRVLYVKHLKQHNKILMQDLSKSNSQLREINIQLDTFAGRVAHDLNSIIALIQSYARLLDKNLASGLDEQSRKFLSRIRSTSDRGASLVFDLLAFARLGEKALEIHNVDLDQVVERARVFAQLEAKQTHIEWRISPMPRVLADESLIEQVFGNLLSNSVKYSRHVDKSIIEVKSSECDTYFHFCIKDNGAGFDPDKVGDLFIPFRRLHDSNVYEGHGLGLVNVKRIIEKHGGEIVASSRPGAGAEFCFTLPKKIDSPDPYLATESLSQSFAGKESVELVSGLISSLVKVSPESIKVGSVVNDFISQFVHKSNNMMLPWVLELDEYLQKMDAFPEVDQLKLKAFDVSIRGQISAVTQMRSLLGKKTPDQFK